MLYHQLAYQPVIQSYAWVPTAVIVGIGLAKYLICYFGWRATAHRNRCLISLVSGYHLNLFFINILMISFLNISVLHESLSAYHGPDRSGRLDTTIPSRSPPGVTGLRVPVVQCIYRVWPDHGPESHLESDAGRGEDQSVPLDDLV